MLLKSSIITDKNNKAEINKIDKIVESSKHDDLFLNLSHCKIKQIDLTFIKENQNLRFLDLSHNEIKELDLDPLKHVPYLERVNLDGNPLKNVDLSPLQLCLNLRNLKISTVKPIKKRTIKKFVYSIDSNNLPLNYMAWFYDDLLALIDRFHYDDHDLVKDLDYDDNKRIIERYVKKYGVPKYIKREVEIKWKFYKTYKNTAHKTKYYKTPTKTNRKDPTICDIITFTLTNNVKTWF